MYIRRASARHRPSVKARARARAMKRGTLGVIDR